MEVTPQDRLALAGTSALGEGSSSRPAPVSSRLSFEAMAIVDREEDLAALASIALDPDVRLLTITGPAGVGKTRLAREVGRKVAARFADGVVFVDLASVRDPELALPAVAQEVGVRDTGDQPLAERLGTYLSDREELLILDNVEQMLPCDAALTGLLSAVRGTTFIVTSREPLHLLREQLYHVQPLELADPEHPPPVETLGRVPSVAFFVGRARMIDRDFELTEQNALSVIELVAQLDGLPLAIGLAAARIQLLSPQMLLERLDRRLSLLRWTATDLPERQRTLGAAIAWSYDLLGPEEQALFRSLGVFAGGFTLEAAEGFIGDVGSPRIDVVDRLGSLVDKSLVQCEDDGAGAYRFRLLDSVREFAVEQLRACGEEAVAEQAHARFFVSFAEQADPQLRGSKQQLWYRRLEREHNNLRLALRWLLDHDESDEALRLSAALGYFWWSYGHCVEGLQWMKATLAAPATAPSTRITALLRLALLTLTTTKEAKDLARVEATAEEALDLARQAGDRRAVVQCLGTLGECAYFAGDLDGGRRALDDALTIAEDLDDDWLIAYAQYCLVAGFLAQGDVRGAVAHCEEALKGFEAVDDLLNATHVKFTLVYRLKVLGDPVRAAQLIREGLETAAAFGDRSQLARGAKAALWLIDERVDPVLRARLLGATDVLHEMTTGAPTGFPLTRTDTDNTSLEGTEERLQQAYREGRSLSFEDVVTLAQEALAHAFEPSESAVQPRIKAAQSDPLSRREREVLGLAARGLSNKEIAVELIIAESTVRYHLTSIFNKLGVDSRTHAVAVAAQRGIIQLNREE